MKIPDFISSMWLILLALWASACSQPEKPVLFDALSSDESGIQFRNAITENDSIVDEYLYMGGGVGIGDFNNDGLKDIYFTGNQVSSRLYINEGDNHFNDITGKANVGTGQWASGVSIADINNDGFDDIYLCVYRGKNKLFINQQNLTFREQAAAYGLDDDRHSTQAVFFDYDKDGRTDIFLTNYLLDGPNPNIMHRPDKTGNSPANDKLYKNTGIRNGHPFFEDVSKQAGIKGDGYGLGVSVSDFNNDSWPDLYVTNDFLSNDELWQNNKDGTFTNIIGTALRHQSYSSMGVDAADLNNDQLQDIITLDMIPEYNTRKKMQYTFMNYERYRQERDFGYQPEFMRNMLQLNNGVRAVANRNEPFFSEIGQYAGVAETDWSWSVLAADFNNDQWKDIFITNGSGRDFLNADFIKYSVSQQTGMRGKTNKKLSQKLVDLGFINIPNYLYINNRDYTFTNARDSSGLAEPTISNGAAYADLDNDGDLDLVVNHINKRASVFVNTTIQNENENAGAHYLKVALTGDEHNLDAFGTNVLAYANGTPQVQEQYPVRGYASSVDPTLFFGLGSSSMADSLVVIWPDNKKQVITDIPADTTLHIKYEQTDDTIPKQENEKNPVFKELNKETSIRYKHLDVPYNDFKSHPLLPQKYSQLGPFITGGDINNDNQIDFFIGGGFNSSGVLFYQQANAQFKSATFDTTIKYQEDMDCVLFDVENDGDLDLLITYGDTRYESGSGYYKPRLYINDGKGDFQLNSAAIPDHVRTIAGAVAVADYDADGYPDVFIGGRISKRFPESPKSFLLHNQQGNFVDATAEMNPDLQNPGMVTSALWTDINSDNRPDLIIAGEWMKIRLFKNSGTELQEVTNQWGIEHGRGLWRSLAACDLDQDGDTDLVAGNLGENNKYNVSDEYPLKIFAADIDQNGFLDPVLFYHIKNENGSRKLYPAISREKLFRQVPTLEKVFASNKDYSTATVDDIFGTVDDENILELTVNETQNIVLENAGKRFIKHPLPPEAQFAPVDAILCGDFNADSNTDVLLAGNEYQTAVRTGRYDASYGTFLKGRGNFNFESISPAQSGFIVDGDVKDMEIITDAKNRRLVLVAVNNDSLNVFRVNQ